MRDLLRDAYYDGPESYSKAKLSKEPNLFEQRAALYFTPTSSIPRRFIGGGILDVMLPIAPPTLEERCIFGRDHGVRLWVDLLQRLTGRIRWTPFRRAKVTYVRYDLDASHSVNSLAGAKGLTDALKVGSWGRPDGRYLFYFGAITDDDHEHLDGPHYEYVAVSHPREAKCRVLVEPA